MPILNSEIILYKIKYVQYLKYVISDVLTVQIYLNLTLDYININIVK